MIQGQDKAEAFNPLKNFINSRLEISVSDSDLEDLIGYAIQADGYENNKGYKWERIEHNPREKAFYEQWLKDNEPRSWINNGQGILQDLFIERNETLPFGQRRWVTEITNRDRMIAATVIQWLGSNVGMGFLHEALRKCDLVIVDKK